MPLLQPIPAAPQILADPPPAAPKKASEMEQAVVQAFSKRGMHGVLYPRRCRRACRPVAFAADQRSACVRAEQPRQATSNVCIVSECRHDRSYAALPLFFHSFHAARNTFTSAF